MFKLPPFRFRQSKSSTERRAQLHLEVLEDRNLPSGMSAGVLGETFSTPLGQVVVNREITLNDGQQLGIGTLVSSSQSADSRFLRDFADNAFIAVMGNDDSSGDATIFFMNNFRLSVFEASPLQSNPTGDGSGSQPTSPTSPVTTNPTSPVTTNPVSPVTNPTSPVATNPTSPIITTNPVSPVGPQAPTQLPETNSGSTNSAEQTTSSGAGQSGSSGAQAAASNAPPVQIQTSASVGQSASDTSVAARAATTGLADLANSGFLLYSVAAGRGWVVSGSDQPDSGLLISPADDDDCQPAQPADQATPPADQPAPPADQAAVQGDEVILPVFDAVLPAAQPAVQPQQ